MTKYFSEYINTILTISVLSFLCESTVVHFSSAKPLSKAFGLISSLCIFSTILLPVTGLLKSCELNIPLPEKSDASMQDTQLFEELTEKDLQQKLSYEIYRASGINPQYISIDLNMSEEQVEILSADIGISNQDYDNSQNIYVIAENHLGKDTKITITKVNNE